MTTVLSAKVIAAFADAMRMRPSDALTFVRNATEDTRRAVADKYGQEDREAREHGKRLYDAIAARKAEDKVSTEIIRQARGRQIYDAMAVRMAMAEDKRQSDGGWQICQTCGYEKCMDHGAEQCNSCRLDNRKAA